MCVDAENFYLPTPLDRPKCIQIKVKLVPQVFIDANNLSSKIYKGFIYMKIVRRMYGIPQEGNTYLLNIGQKVVEETSQETLFLWRSPHSRPIYTQNKTHLVYLVRWWFWGEICWQRTRILPNECSQAILQDGIRLERAVILWNHTRLALHRRSCRQFYVKICV